MRIAILVEGKTEMAFKPHLIAFLQTRLAGKMAKSGFLPHTMDGSRRASKRESSR